jgi:hypothetical protein
MAATAAPSQTLMSVPRVRFFAASIFIVSSYIYLLSRIVSGTEFSALYRTAMFASIFIELLTLRMSVPVMMPVCIVSRNLQIIDFLNDT